MSSWCRPSYPQDSVKIKQTENKLSGITVNTTSCSNVSKSTRDILSLNIIMYISCSSRLQMKCWWLWCWFHIINAFQESAYTKRGVLCICAQISALFCQTKLSGCAQPGEREILFVFLFCWYLPAFYGPRSSFVSARECKREGEKESILNFLLKRKFICSC